MSTEPAAPTPTNAAHGRAPRWRGARRAVLYAASASVAAGALTALACAGDGVTGAPVATAAPEGATGPLLTAKSGDGALTPGDLAWIGREHNVGIARVVAQLRAAHANRGDLRQVCGLAVAEAVQYLPSRAGFVPAEVGALLTPATFAPHLGRAGRELCVGHSLAASAASSTELASGTETLASTSGEVPPVSEDALFLIQQIDNAIDASPSAAALSSALAPIESQAGSLATTEEQAIVLSAASVARASSQYIESYCPGGVCGGGGGGGGGGGDDGGGPAMMRTPAGSANLGRGGFEVRSMDSNINPTVVKADVWGCIWGGFRGLAGGPPGVFAGCLWGGLGSSGGVIFQYLM